MQSFCPFSDGGFPTADRFSLASSGWWCPYAHCCLVDVMNAASFCPLGAGSPLSQTLPCPQSLFARWLWWALPALPLAVSSGHRLLEGPTADADPTCPSLKLSPGATVYLSQGAGLTHHFSDLLAWAPPALAVPEKAHSQLLCREERRRDPEALGREGRGEPLCVAVPQLHVESAWSGFVAACPCHPDCCHGVCGPGLPLRAQVVAP